MYKHSYGRTNTPIQVVCWWWDSLLFLNAYSPFTQFAAIFVLLITDLSYSWPHLTCSILWNPLKGICPTTLLNLVLINEVLVISRCWNSFGDVSNWILKRNNAWVVELQSKYYTQITWSLHKMHNNFMRYWWKPF